MNPENTIESDSIGKVLPRRPLGRTGESVTMLGLGGFHIGWNTEELAHSTIEAALEEGVRFFDTAEGYGPHTSEERYGRFLTPQYRKEIFLMSKSAATDPVTAQEHLEGTLRRLRIDVLDLWQIHGLDSPEDVDQRFDAGVINYALKARDEGKVRHLGFTGHASPYAHLRFLERLGNNDGFATAQFPINPVDAVSKHSFIRELLPELASRGYGVLAMKTLADGRFFKEKTMLQDTVWTTAEPVIPDKVSVAEAIRFALSLPISVLITGADHAEHVREKAALVREFVALEAVERASLLENTSGHASAGIVEFYKTEALRG